MKSQWFFAGLTSLALLIPGPAACGAFFGSPTAEEVLDQALPEQFTAHYDLVVTRTRSVLLSEAEVQGKLQRMRDQMRRRFEKARLPSAQIERIIAENIGLLEHSVRANNTEGEVTSYTLGWRRFGDRNFRGTLLREGLPYVDLEGDGQRAIAEHAAGHPPLQGPDGKPLPPATEIPGHLMVTMANEAFFGAWFPPLFGPCRSIIDAKTERRTGGAVVVRANVRDTAFPNSPVVFTYNFTPQGGRLLCDRLHMLFPDKSEDEVRFVYDSTASEHTIPRKVTTSTSLGPDRYSFEWRLKDVKPGAPGKDEHLEFPPGRVVLDKRFSPALSLRWKEGGVSEAEIAEEAKKKPGTVARTFSGPQTRELSMPSRFVSFLYVTGGLAALGAAVLFVRGRKA